MSNLLDVILIFFLAILGYALHRPVLAALRRFERRNAERRAQEARVLMDRYAHYRQTVQFVEEQIEEVAKVTVTDERTGEPVSRYLFLGTYYANRKDAEAARYATVIERAREFYLDLDRIYLSKGRAQRPAAAPPALTDASKHPRD
jgi:hypothetical protein